MKHDRFRNLEGERSPPAESVEPHSSKVSNRFAAVDAPPQGDDFKIDPRDARGQRAHTRCIECAHENGNYADACEKCHATLLTRAVHRLNVRLHQDEQAAATAQRDATPVVEDSLVVREPVEQRKLLDRVATELGVEPRLARALVLGAITTVFGLLFLATGLGVVGLVLGLIVTLGLYLLVA